MRKSKTVEIDGKKYKIEELTVEEIINLTKSSRFFNTSSEPSSKEEQNSGLQSKDEYQILREDIEAVMDVCCDFKISSLFKMTPSSINLLIDTFKEVNSDFFGWLKVLGIQRVLDEVLQGLRETILQDFLKMHVI